MIWNWETEGIELGPTLAPFRHLDATGSSGLATGPYPFAPPGFAAAGCRNAPKRCVGNTLILQQICCQVRRLAPIRFVLIGWPPWCLSSRSDRGTKQRNDRAAFQATAHRPM